MNALSPAPDLTPKPPDVGDRDRRDDDSDPGLGSIRRPTRPRSPGPRNSANTLAIKRLANKSTSGQTGRVAVYSYRYLDPLTGRWTSPDPIGEQGGSNLYAFVGNNGLNAWDNLGLEWAWERSLGDYLHNNLGAPPRDFGDYMSTSFGAPPKAIVDAVSVVESTGNHLSSAATSAERQIGDSLAANLGNQGTGSYVDGFARSSASMLDGINVFGDPLRNEYNLNDPGMRLCRNSGITATFLVGGAAAYRVGQLGLRAAFATESGYFWGGTWVAGGQQYWATAQTAMVRAQLIGARTIGMTIGGRVVDVTVRTLQRFDASPAVTGQIWRWASGMFARNTGAFGGMYGPGGPIWLEVERQILQNRGLFPRS